MIRFKLLPIVAFKVYEASGVAGDTLDFVLPSDTPQTDLAANAVFTEGEIGVERLDGNVPEFVPFTHVAGFSTFEYPTAKVVRQGAFRYTVISATARYYCILPCAACPKGTRVSGIVHHTPVPVSVPVGRYLFVAKGTVTFDGDPFDAPFLFFVQSAPTTFDLSAGALALTLWR
jgi:hypothetical protein